MTVAAVAAAPLPASCASPDCRPLALTANRTIVSYAAAPDQYSYCDERHPGFIARAQWWVRRGQQGEGVGYGLYTLLPPVFQPFLCFGKR